MAAGPVWDRILLRRVIGIDPVASFGTAITARVLFDGLLGAGVLLFLTLVLGRFFCAWACPLGTIIDGADKISGRRNRELPRLAYFKYFVLLALLGLCLGGFSGFFLFSPLAIGTRLFALIVDPLLRLGAAAGIDLLRPLADRLDFASLVYAQVKTPSYQSLTWILLLTFVPVAGAVFFPRLWCRSLCPTGALLGLFSRLSLWRRQVAETCISCGRCARECPTQAIPEDFLTTHHGECIVCRRCVAVCPVGAVHFSFCDLCAPQASAPDQGRRALLGFAALSAFTGGFFFAASKKKSAGKIPLRPPGARPETDFRDRCIRCGACMSSCPTNTLQPAGTITGFSGLLAPVMTPVVGPCEPDCSACGQVCPTQAIMSLLPEEKWWARPGKAEIIRERCLAWKDERICLICDEACPFDAVVLKRAAGISLPVPFVHAHRCSGCGYCEFQCPVQGSKAIVVAAEGAIRLNEKRYREAGRLLGLRIRRESSGQQTVHEWDIHTSPEKNGLPPGFSR